MNKFIRIDGDYINTNHIVKIEEDRDGDAVIIMATQSEDDSRLYTQCTTTAIMELINDAERNEDAGLVVNKKKAKKAKAVNKFANLDVDGLF